MDGTLVLGFFVFKKGATWRRPVPGWRQSEKSVTLENRGYHFEEAEFEAHFRDQGKEAWCFGV